MPWYGSWIATILVGAVSGPIGCAILREVKANVGGLDPAHAAAAGALGGVIAGPLVAVCAPIIASVMLVVISPLLVAITFCIQRIGAHMVGA